MKKTIISLLMAAASLGAAAQVVNASAPIKVDGIAASEAVLSPDGKYIVCVTGRGIERMAFAGGDASLVSDIKDASHLAVTSDDGAVVFRRSHIGQDRLRRVSLESVKLKDGKHQVIVEPSRRLNTGVSLRDGIVTAVNDGAVLSRRVIAAPAARTAAGKAPATPAPVASINMGHLEVTVDGTTRAIDPLGTESYICPSISPDGQRVLFRAVGRGTYVCNLDGSGVQRLAESVEYPVWAGNDVVIGTVTKDDGMFIYAGRLMAVSVSTGAVQQLCPEEMVAMRASASADGRRALFTTAAGEVYTMTLK